MKEKTFLRLIGIPIFAGFAVPGWQVFHWLATDNWETLTGWSATLFLGAPYPVTSWAGVNHLLQILPLFVCVLIACLLWALLLGIGLTIPAWIRRLRDKLGL